MREVQTERKQDLQACAAPLLPNGPYLILKAEILDVTALLPQVLENHNFVFCTDIGSTPFPRRTSGRIKSVALRAGRNP